MKLLTDEKNRYTQNTIPRLLFFLGLAGIVMSLSSGNLALSVLVLCIPFIIISVYGLLNKPVYILYLIFSFNYFVMGIMRYQPLDGASVIFDTLLICNLILVFIHGIILKNVEWKLCNNVMTWILVLWAVYCALEVVNPTAVFDGWYLSRLLIYGGLITSIIASLTVNEFKQVKNLLMLYSIFTLFAVMKCYMQKIYGFDYAELVWLEEGNKSTHIIATGIRYFSFFTDAGNFGSNMGCAGVVFALTALSIKNKSLKVYYFILSALSIHAMMLSGTRGAMIVPLGGIALYIIISKNIKAITIGGISLAFIYVFFAFTTIGQGNAEIRRMRTAFHPDKDPSYLVRKTNRAILGAYLKNKPFGEGLGLAGVENQKTSYRFTTSIPHDSWYVKIWVETGIVGLSLYLLSLIIIVGRSMYILMFKIRDLEVRGVLGAMLCGIFGMMLSAYGNAFWGQFPTMIISYIFLALCIKGESFDNKLLSKVQNNTIII